MHTPGQISDNLIQTLVLVFVGNGDAAIAHHGWQHKLDKDLAVQVIGKELGIGLTSSYEGRAGIVGNKPGQGKGSQHDKNKGAEGKILHQLKGQKAVVSASLLQGA